jgi:hypothetical protein
VTPFLSASSRLAGTGAARTHDVGGARVLRRNGAGQFDFASDREPGDAIGMQRLLRSRTGALCDSLQPRRRIYSRILQPLSEAFLAFGDMQRQAGRREIPRFPDFFGLSAKASDA